MNEIATTLPDEARLELAAALERIRGRGGLIVRVSELLAGTVGSAAALGLRRLRPPAFVQQRARGVAQAALRRAFDVAVLGMPSAGLRARIEARASRAAAAASGAVGGFAGMAGFLPDVALTTLLIMRRIAAIAVEEGESTTDPGARAACLEVFALGGGADEPGKQDEEPELGYWGARLMMQGRPLLMLMSEAARLMGCASHRSSRCRRCRLSGPRAGRWSMARSWRTTKASPAPISSFVVWSEPTGHRTCAGRRTRLLSRTHLWATSRKSRHRAAGLRTLPRVRQPLLRVLFTGLWARSG